MLQGVEVEGRGSVNTTHFVFKGCLLLSKLIKGEKNLYKSKRHSLLEAARKPLEGSRKPLKV